MHTSITPNLRARAAALALLAAAACGASKPGPTPDPGLGGIPDLRTLTTAQADEAEAVARAFTRTLGPEVLGADAAAVFATIDSTERALIAQIGAQPPFGVARRSPLPQGAVAQASGLAGGLTIATLGGTFNDALSGASGSTPGVSAKVDTSGGSVEAQMQVQLTSSGPTVTGGVTGSATYTAGGEVLMRETMTGSVEGSFCPDASGLVRMTYSLAWTSDFVKAVGGAQTYLSGTATAAVDDEGVLTSWTSDTHFTTARQTPVGVAGASGYVETHTQRHISLGATSTTVQLLGSEVVREQGGDADFARAAAAGQHSLPSVLESLLFHNAQGRWQGGRCVEILVDGASDANDVAPSSTTPFTARVRHRFEGVDLDSGIQGTLSGESSLSPTAKTPAPVSYAYRAPAEEGKSATANLETHSKRGWAKKAVAFTVKPLLAYTGTITFSGTVSSSGENVTFEGSTQVALLRTFSGPGGATYRTDGASGSTSVTRWDDVTSTKACDLVGVATGGAGSATVVLSVAGTTYSFAGAVLADGSLRCVYASDGHVEIAPVTVGWNVTTSSGGADPGWQPLGDGALLAGSATWTAPGVSATTTWNLVRQ